MIITLAQPFTSRFGRPILDRVDTEIFSLRYYQPCLSCSFCNDQCCSYGVDVEADTHENILRLGPTLGLGSREQLAQKFTGVWVDDGEFPGGRMTRTLSVNGRCVFLNAAGRGCQLHAAALEHGLDYHLVKPLVSSLFPMTFDEGLLHASDEVGDKSLVCAGSGATLYEGGRSELSYYFGAELVSELDGLARAHEHEGDSR